MHFNRSVFLIAAALMSSVTMPAALIPMAPQVSRRVRKKRPPYVARYPRLNRSQHWTPATSYNHARAISPVPTMPVR
jgi:hypothetical protein